jgi:hypothetical protein
MSLPSEWTAYVEVTTDANPTVGSELSAWTAWGEVTTDAGPAVQVRKLRRAGAWVDTTGRQFRRNGAWV